MLVFWLCFGMTVHYVQVRCTIFTILNYFHYFGLFWYVASILYFHIENFEIPQLGTEHYEYHGGAAVTLFFVVSGFIMTVAYLDKVDAEPSFDYFFLLRRLARLVPVHWFR